MNCFPRIRVCVAGTFLLFASVARAEVDFYRDVYPALKANCVACHNKSKTEGALNLEVPESVRKGGDTGPGVIAGKSAESLVYLSANHEGDYIMPPEGNTVQARKLTENELKALAAWIDEGAKDSVQVAQKIQWRQRPAQIHPIYSVAITEDGRWGACGRGDQVALYDLGTRQFTSILIDPALAQTSPAKTHLGLVDSLAFSPDGTRLASGGYREVKIWKRLPNGEVEFTAVGPADAISRSLSNDGQMLAALDATGKLHLTDSIKGNELKVFPIVVAKGDATQTPDEKPAVALTGPIAISPQNSTIAVQSSETEISIWNAADGARLFTVTAPAKIQAIAWGNTPQTLLVAAEDKVLRVWKIPAEAKGDLAAPAEIPLTLENTFSLHRLASPERWVALGQDGQVRIFAAADSKLLHQFQIPGTTVLACSPDGKLLAASGPDGVIRVWDSQTAKQVIELRGDMQSRSELAAVTRHSAVQAMELDYHNKEVARLNAANTSLTAVIKKANETIETANKVLPDKRKAAEASAAAKATQQTEMESIAAKIAALPEGTMDAELEKQKTANQQSLMKAAADDSTAQMTLKESENHLRDATGNLEAATAAEQKNKDLLAASQASIETLKKSTEEVKAQLAETQKKLAEQKLQAIALAFSPDSKSVSATFQNGEQRDWGIASGAPLSFVPGGLTDASASMAVTPTGDVVTLFANGQRRLIHPGFTWQLERVLGGESNLTAFADRVNVLQFSPDGTVLATGGGEPSRSGEVGLWKVETGEPLQSWNDLHKDAVLSMDFSPDGTLLATGASDRLVKIVEVSTGRVVNLFEGHTHHALGVSFRADGRLLASSGADSIVIIWDMQSGEQARQIKGWTKEVSSAQFLGVTSTIATSAGESLLRIVNDQGGQVKSLSLPPAFLHTAASPADGSVILTGGEDGVLHLCNPVDGKEIMSFPAPN